MVSSGLIIRPMSFSVNFLKSSLYLSRSFIVGPAMHGMFEEFFFPRITVGREGIHPPPDIVWGRDWAELARGRVGHLYLVTWVWFISHKGLIWGGTALRGSGIHFWRFPEHFWGDLGDGYWGSSGCYSPWYWEWSFLDVSVWWVSGFHALVFWGHFMPSCWHDCVGRLH